MGVFLNENATERPLPYTHHQGKWSRQPDAGRAQRPEALDVGETLVLCLAETGDLTCPLLSTSSFFFSVRSICGGMAGILHADGHVLSSEMGGATSSCSIVSRLPAKSRARQHGPRTACAKLKDCRTNLTRQLSRWSGSCVRPVGWLNWGLSLRRRIPRRKCAFPFFHAKLPARALSCRWNAGLRALWALYPLQS